MPTINVTKSFPFSPDGKTVIEYDKGQHDVSERCAVVAVEHLEVASLLTDDEKQKLEAEAQAKAEAEAKAAEEAAAQVDSQQPPPPTKATKTTTKK